MTTPLTLDTAHGSDGRFVLVVEGEIDLSNVDAFHQALAGATTQATDSENALVVDISAVEYLDSAAISALVAHANRIEVLANPILMSVLRISGLSELTKIAPAPPTAGQ